MENRSRIQRASRRLRRLLLAIFWIMPLVNAAMWLAVNQLPGVINDGMVPGFVNMPLPLYVRMLAIVATMIPIGVAMAGVHTLMRLFGLYEQGRIFRSANVACYRRLSRVLIAWFFAGIVSNSLLSLALTLHHPPGQHILTVELGSTDLTALLVGAILALIAWVMEEGRRLQEEQDLTV